MIDDLEKPQPIDMDVNTVDEETVDAARNALLNALREVEVTGGVRGGTTTRELARELEWCIRRVRDRLRLEVERGTIEMVQEPRVNMAGVTQRVYAYRVKVQPEKQKEEVQDD